MSKANFKSTQSSTKTPLDRLHLILKDDMTRTNDLIVKRLESDVNVIPKVANYIIAAGGKRIRPLLTLAGAKAFADEGNMDNAHLLAAAVEFIHTATLLHDDVVDDSDQRRGQQSSHVIFGNETAVLVGDFLFARAFELMVETDRLEVLGVLSKASAIITEGEVKQLSTTRQIDTGIEEYFKVINGKTAALFAAACSVGTMVADQSGDMQKKLHDYGQNLGMAFQITDDILDYSANEAKLGKETGDDFREGKMTLPVILSVQQASGQEKAFWKRVIETPEEIKAEDFPYAQNLLVRHGIYDQATKIANEHAKKAHEALENIPDTPIKKILIEILDYSVKRLH